LLMVPLPRCTVGSANAVQSSLSNKGRQPARGAIPDMFKTRGGGLGECDALG
jgi:hypothetical protein